MVGIGANHDTAFQAYDPVSDFGSNEYHYGLNSFIPSQSTLSVPGAHVLGGPSSASVAQSVLDNKTEVLS